MTDRRASARQDLADQRVFLVAHREWVGFIDVLKRPAMEIPGLNDLMRTPTVLDRT